MAERLTVDQEVVGSTPIWHPNQFSCVKEPVYVNGLFCFNTELDDRKSLFPACNVGLQ
jgi:hypothetical protein